MTITHYHWQIELAIRDRDPNQLDYLLHLIRSEIVGPDKSFLLNTLALTCELCRDQLRIKDKECPIQPITTSSP